MKDQMKVSMLSAYYFIGPASKLASFVKPGLVQKHWFEFWQTWMSCNYKMASFRITPLEFKYARGTEVCF